MLMFPCKSLDVIGRVGFGHDFESGQSKEAVDIRSSWDDVSKFGLTFNGFMAPLIIRTFPFLTNLLLTTQGKVRTIVSKISMGIIESSRPSDLGRDILSLLLRENRKIRENLTAAQIVANVCCRQACHFLC